MLHHHLTDPRYGNIALGFESDYSTNIPKPRELFSTAANYFLADDNQIWIYIFLESAPQSLTLSVYTNRTVRSTWSCNSWPVIQGGNGTVTNLMIFLDAKSSKDLKLILQIAGGTDQTSFLTATDVTFGPGCSIVEAFEASLTQPWYYSCNITVGQAMNAMYHPEHDLGISLPTMASAAIALQGYVLNSSATDGTQYQVHLSESVYGQPQGGYNSGMGSLMCQFAIGVVDTAAIYSSQSLWLTIEGLQPETGNQLTVS